MKIKIKIDNIGNIEFDVEFDNSINKKEMEDVINFLLRIQREK